MKDQTLKTDLGKESSLLHVFWVRMRQNPIGYRRHLELWNIKLPTDYMGNEITIYVHICLIDYHQLMNVILISLPMDLFEAMNAFTVLIENYIFFRNKTGYLLYESLF